MDKTLAAKNEFIKSLRDHLMIEYGTTEHYTFGEGPYKTVIEENAYCLVRKKPSEQEDLGGFCFRKDLCLGIPFNEDGILKDIKKFVSKHQNLEIRLIDRSSDNLILGFGDREYMVSTYIGEGCEDEVTIDFFHLPTISIS